MLCVVECAWDFDNSYFFEVYYPFITNLNDGFYWKSCCKNKKYEKQKEISQ